MKILLFLLSVKCIICAAGTSVNDYLMIFFFQIIIVLPKIIDWWLMKNYDFGLDCGIN